MSRQRFVFEPFELDAQSGELRRGSHVLRLGPQPARLLCLLASRPGELVTREEARRHLWSDAEFVDFDLGLNHCMKRIRAALREDPRHPRFIETVPRRGYRFVARVQQTCAFDQPALAVLTFENLNRDPAIDYLADGFTEAVITELGTVPGLRVVSRRSVLHLDAAGMTAAQIARALNADAIVQGSLFRDGRRMRVNAQLLLPDPERQIWAQALETELGDALAAQRELAHGVAAAVLGQLPAAGPASRPPVSRVDEMAYEAHLKAAFHLRQLSPGGFTQALRLMRECTERDPGFAAGHARLAHTLSMAAFMGQMPPRDGYVTAKDYARRALELDATVSLAHAAMALAELSYDWSAAAAERSIQRALALNPSDLEAHFARANLLITLGRRPEEAIEEARLMLSLDPLSPAARVFLAWIHFWSRRYAEAARWAAEALETRTDVPMAWNALGWTQVAASRYDEAASSFEKAVALARDPVYVAFLGYAHARAGRTAAAIALLEEIIERDRRSYVPPKSFAILYTGLGDFDRAFAYLEQLFEDRDGYLFFVDLCAHYDPLRSDGRFGRMHDRLRAASTGM